jgi:hypothetical protein
LRYGTTAIIGPSRRGMTNIGIRPQGMLTGSLDCRQE